MNISLSANTRIHRIAVSIFFFIVGLVVATWASRIPDIKNTLHLNDAQLGGVLLAIPVGQIIGLPLSGWLISKFGSRQLIIASAIFFPLTLILAGFTVTVWPLVIVLFFFGMWSNLANIAMNTQAVGVELMYGRSIMASFHGLWSLAGFCGAAIGNFFVAERIPPLFHFSLIALAAIIMVVISYRNTLPDNYKRSPEPLFIKPDKAVLLLGFIAFCSMICEGAMADWIGVYFQNIIQSPAAYKTLGYVAFAGTMATGRFAGDRLITKFGVKRILQFSGVLIASGLLIVILLPYLASAIAGCLLVGFGASCVVPIVYAMAGKSITMSPGLALAAVSTISFAGFLIGPPLIGFIAQLAGLKISFAIIAVLGLGVSFFGNKISR